MIVEILSYVLTFSVLGGMFFAMGCGYATLYMAIANKATEHKRVKLERKYLCKFDTWCAEHAEELTESEVIE